MPSKQVVSDEALSRALGMYAGMVSRVLTNPRRWLGVDEDPPLTAGFPVRFLDAVRDRAFGEVTPASPAWAEQPESKRVEWWLRRIAIGAALAAAAPRFVGAMADRIPLQAALGASAAGLAVCAVARERGTVAPADWVPLLARVLFDRDLTGTAAPVPTADQSEDQLETAASDTSEPPSTMAALAEGAQRVVRTLWRLARTFLDIQDLFDKRPRGGLFARTLAKLPVVGVAGGWLDERGAIHKAARQTNRLLT
ncbi:MAG TPA: hypothetical protein VFP27_05520 [Mycobacterium sp.]|nr:hypothetical protein [Mycobacterium sp.]